MSKINRREFLERAALLGAAVGAGAFMVGCNKGGGGLSCTDTAGLAAADVATRTNNNYVDASTQAGKDCAGCALYQAGAEGACGTCTVVKGPINPAGYCNLWAARPA
ncbi:MAG: high-potential iron-sulfur protein [Myxococcales bacterium]|nr:high-potential iron-sulfur protein [Myxococcales bacterium]